MAFLNLNPEGEEEQEAEVVVTQGEGDILETMKTMTMMNSQPQLEEVVSTLGPDGEVLELERDAGAVVEEEELDFLAWTPLPARLQNLSIS